MSDEVPAKQRSTALSATAESIMAAIVANYRRSKLINAELNVLLDVEDEQDMLRDLEDLLAQENDRFAEVFARTCQSKIRWAESRRGTDSSSTLIEAFERAFSLSTDIARVGRLELLLKATRRYSVQQARRQRRPPTE